MKKDKPVVTLIGVGQAEAGRIFIHKGPSPKCEDCDYFNVCIGNLESERAYRIVKIRDKTLPCRLYEAEMQVVEVIEAEMPSAISSQIAIERAIITFNMPNCNMQGCRNYELCFPKVLKNGDRCKILKVDEDINCPFGLPLRRAFLLRVPSS